jgi:hypothetical protein
VRTSGAGVDGVSVVVVVVVVVVVGAGVGFGFGVVLVVVVDGAGSEGAGSAGGAGTVVVPAEVVVASGDPMLSVASAAPANARTNSAARSESSVAIMDRRIITGQLPSR